MAMGLEAAGAYLRVFRDARKLTQEEVAAALGVSGKQVSNWERGVHDPKSSFLAALLNLLHAPSNEVVRLLSTSASVEEGERAARRLLEEERMAEERARLLSIEQERAILDARPEDLSPEDLEWVINQLRERVRARSAERERRG